jgi:ribonuclease HIII
LKPVPSTRFPEELRLLLDRESVEITGSRTIDYGIQYDLARDGETAKLNVYRTGKISTGGSASGLRDLIEAWRTSPSGAGGKRASAARAGGGPVLDGTPRLGIDEAGKGDYFGPLVVAGVRITRAEMAQRLLEIGVRDSKEIVASSIRWISGRILEAVGRNNVHVLSLAPGEYESRRSTAGNVNRLLGELDARIMGELVGEVEVVVVDEFARSARSYLEPYVPEGVRLEVRTRAEDDAAVAAASIVARARQLVEIDRLSERAWARKA